MLAFHKWSSRCHTSSSGKVKRHVEAWGSFRKTLSKLILIRQFLGIPRTDHITTSSDFWITEGKSGCY